MRFSLYENEYRYYMIKHFKELWAYREMIISLVKRDLRGRYKGSALGFAWTFINPLLQLAVYTMVFSIIMRNGIEDYYLYLFVALIPWLFFSACLSGAGGCIRGQADMVKKIYFPRAVIPLSYTISNFVNMLLSLIVVFVVVLISGKPINVGALCLLPLIMVIEFFICLGITLIVSAVSVFMRDVEYVMGILAMAWQFATPVMYGLESVPAVLVPYFNLNPMTSVIVAYRDILYYGQFPELSTLLSAIVFGILMTVIGSLVFEKLQRRFAEEL